MVEIDDDALAAAREELNNGPRSETRAFVFACELSEIPPSGRRGKVVELEDQEIALLNNNGELFAFSNICPHEDSPILSAGFFDKEGCTVACPLHGWTYDMRTGARLDEPNGSIAVYPIKIEADKVYVEVLLQHN